MNKLYCLLWCTLLAGSEHPQKKMDIEAPTENALQVAVRVSQDKIAAERESNEDIKKACRRSTVRLITVGTAGATMLITAGVTYGINYAVQTSNNTSICNN